MIDPMTALGLAGNIIQFVDFAIKLFAKTREIHESAEGSLRTNLDIENATKTIQILQSKLIAVPSADNAQASETQHLLEGLCSSCNDTATELLRALEKLKLQGKKTTWKSMRQALKSIMGKAAILELSSRLDELRKVLEMTILVDLRYVKDR